MPEGKLDYLSPAGVRPMLLVRELSVGRLIVAVVVASLLAVAAGTAYVEMQHGARSPKLRFACLVAVAVAVALICGGTARFSLVRRRVTAGLIGLPLGVVALYAMWVVWTYNLLATALPNPPGHLALALSPYALAEFIWGVMDEGVWEYDHKLVRGWPLAVIWALEAAIVLTASTGAAALSVYKGLPVCGRCRSQCLPAPRLPRFSGEHFRELRAALESADFDALSAIPAPEHEDAPELALRLYCCPGCRETNVLDLDLIAWTTATTPPSVATTRVLQGMLFGSAQVLALAQALESVRAARDPADSTEPDAPADAPASEPASQSPPQDPSPRSG